ncbi:CPBP family intramembrane glutamic endopeptidase [Pseudonocardia sp. ICBG1293]|uniref:CPBP family intramembrane glutamic endopeptidase n=1 Tax=Pseudonocardia sp. ICBG1293 TaxID=2844382 RepID=UPI001CCE70E0|nr:CPBP family intramembrane glutamic endopeptidase [Pseudonocardia sp. ICBG1293]
MTSTFLVDYPLRLGPGLIVLGAGLVLVGRSSPLLRIVLLVWGFVLVRDAMTPLGLWSIGLAPHGLLWLRLSPDPVVLLGMGTLGVVASLVVAHGPQDLRGTVVWGRIGPRSLLAALGAAAVLLVPLTTVLRTVPVEQRGGAVAIGLLPALAVLAFGGNLLEEVLFRGLLQGRLAELPGFGPARTVAASGLLFAAGHVFLATTVTDLGWPILAFTAAEGLLCAWVRHGHGVLAATLTHGTVILVFASGL